MPDWKARPDYKGFMFPKRKRKSTKSRYKKATTPEAQIQEFANNLLDAQRIFYIRIPNALNQWIILNAPIHIKKLYSDTIKSLPDNIVLLPLLPEHGISMALMLELKSDVGKLKKGQRDLDRMLGLKVCRSTDEVQDAIARTLKFLEDLKNVIDTGETESGMDT